MNPEVESDPVMITRTSTDPKALGTSSSPAGRLTGANSGDVAQQSERPLTTTVTAASSRPRHGLERLSTDQTRPVDSRDDTGRVR
jgi:hypothetical protein